MTAARYRLPDWLGSHPVIIIADLDRFIAQADGMVLTETCGPHHNGHQVAVRRDALVDVRPPSIDDPSKWPLDIGHGITSMRLRESRPDDMNRGVDDPVAAIVANQGVHMAIRVVLTEDDLRNLARSAWQFAEGRRRFDEIQAEARQRESKIWACPEGCGYHIADGPVPDGEPPTFELIQEHEQDHRDQDGLYPYPGDEVAVRLPGGGWRVELDKLNDARTRLLPTVSEFGTRRCPTGPVQIEDGSVGRWTCTRHTGDWHAAIAYGVIVAAWPEVES